MTHPKRIDDIPLSIKYIGGERAVVVLDGGPDNLGAVHSKDKVIVVGPEPVRTCATCRHYSGIIPHCNGYGMCYRPNDDEASPFFVRADTPMTDASLFTLPTHGCNAWQPASNPPKEADNGDEA